MNEKDISIDKYVAWLNEGKSYQDIREDMQAQDCSEKQINTLIPYIERKFFREAQKQANKRVNWGFVGGAITVVSAVALFVADSNAVYYYGLAGLAAVEVMIGFVYQPQGK
ncbi:hypothetical protein [Microscilla marina]|uniref:Uncharacterized protein n=1 Tax=Microscilla marina ATCC 23134 TaxID=313606 RepID=A1ZR91_MICM2|nr:hypothetical protein [Microscilla marina]EAY27180.1 hypothetical protein M23134_08454 [Microscilla marina ATCC 23134]